METASWVLLIIVSSVLTLFLLILIIAVIYAVKILKQVRRITERAENVAGSVEAAASTFEKAASPLVVLKLIGGIVEHASRFRKRKD